MRNLVSVLTIVLLASGCSWQNTLNAAARTPGYLRLDERIWVENTPRWRLAPDTSVVLANDGQAPQVWLDAASAGIASIFPADHRAQYMLKVAWPPAPAPAPAPQQAAQTTTYKTGLFGLLEAPKIPASQSLDVQLVDDQGQFVANMRVHIRPELWGPTWQDMTLLKDSFTHLARALRGS